MLRLAAVLFALTFGIAFVPGISTGASGGPYGSVSGSGWRGNVAHPTTPVIHFEVSGQNGPGGVSGSFTSHNPTNALLDFRGDVTCLLVSGDHALVGGVTTAGGAAGQIGTGFAIGFVDTASPAPDLVTFSDVALGMPVDCVAEAAVLFGLPTFTVLRGNVAVNDAS
jgi:hypothetical protein